MAEVAGPPCFFAFITKGPAAGVGLTAFSGDLLHAANKGSKAIIRIFFIYGLLEVEISEWAC